MKKAVVGGLSFSSKRRPASTDLMLPRPGHPAPKSFLIIHYMIMEFTPIDVVEPIRYLQEGRGLLLA